MNKDNLQLFPTDSLLPQETRPSPEDLGPCSIEEWTPEEIVAWAAARFGSRLVFTCSFGGGGGLVLAHIIHRHRLHVPTLFLDTGFHFPETLRFKKEFAARFNLEVIDVRPALSVAEQSHRFGPRLYARDPDLCCTLRKVAPLAAALLDRGANAWLSALRRDQAVTRQHTAVVERHVVEDVPMGEDDAPSPRRRQPMLKIHPLARWTAADVARYLHDHNLPYHPLIDAGYTSIGCQPCTRPPRPGETARGGRWADTGKTECGLHTFTDRLPPHGGARRATEPRLPSAPRD